MIKKEQQVSSIWFKFEFLLTLCGILVVFIVLQDEHLSQILSNILQVKERGATTIVLTTLADISTLIDLEKINFLI